MKYRDNSESVGDVAAGRVAADIDGPQRERLELIEALLRLTVALSDAKVAGLLRTCGRSQCSCTALTRAQDHAIGVLARVLGDSCGRDGAGRDARMGGGVV